MDAKAKLSKLQIEKEKIEQDANAKLRRLKWNMKLWKETEAEYKNK
jgi:hypothetical protein